MKIAIIDTLCGVPDFTVFESSWLGGRGSDRQLHTVTGNMGKGK